MTRDQNPDRLDDGARAEAEMKEREAKSEPKQKFEDTFSGETAVLKHYAAPQGDDTLVGEIDRLRKALIETGRHIGAGLADTVSTDFLMLVPEEAQLKMASQAERIAALENWNRLRAEDIMTLGKQVGATESLLAEAREALEPFVAAFEKRRDAYSRRYSDRELGYANFDKMPDRWKMEPIGFTMSAFRRARATLSRLKQGEKGAAE